MTWRSWPLVELCEINIGRTPSRNSPEYWGAGWPWLSIADMNQGRRLRHTKEQISSLAASSVMGSPVAPGTVALSFKLSIGKVGIIDVPMFTNEAIATLPIRRHPHADARRAGTHVPAPEASSASGMPPFRLNSYYSSRMQGICGAGCILVVVTGGLVGRDLQPVGGHRADHLSDVPPATGGHPDREGAEGEPHRRADREPDLHG